MRIPTRNMGGTDLSKTLPTENELEKSAYIKSTSGVIKVS